MPRSAGSIEGSGALGRRKTEPTLRGCWRIRSADYRVLHEVRDRDVLVLIIAIGHRGDVYRT